MIGCFGTSVSENEQDFILINLSGKKFDVLVIGAGHAGVEAALASSRLGLSTLLVTNNLERMGYMSCNPSIGGLAKGHMVKEIDILGGLMGVAADRTCIQFKRLNSSKGPAVRGSRAQCDKGLYSQFVTESLSREENLQIAGIEIERLLIESGRCVGVVSTDGVGIRAKTVVVTTGTFMNAVMHFGLRKVSGGRIGDKATYGISDQLRDFGFSVSRLKTGTPARAAKSSINWASTKPQSGDERFIPFSLRSAKQPILPQIDCYITYTNAKTHEIIRNNLDKSPMFCGVIEGIGPRYCPSIEDKITRFVDKDRHQSFLEPEGLTSDLVYIQGMSTSLPEEVQIEFLRTMPGLENVKLIRPGYAVEYDFVEPTQLWATLETKSLPGLYLAGQVNGTSGYEEAAAQGLVAGANAAFACMGSEPFVLRRDQAYIGVLIDDLVTRGTREPYRMMTSRAEHRLVLREDNVLERLGSVAIGRGLVPTSTVENYSRILNERSRVRSILRDNQVVPNAQTQSQLADLGTPVLQKPQSLEELLRRNEIKCHDLITFNLALKADFDEILEPVEIEVKYEGYIQRQLEFIRQANDLEKILISKEFDYSLVQGLSSEEREKLSRIRPLNLGQAQRISGINPSALQAIMVFLRANDRQRRAIRQRAGFENRV